jgi:hypothetical protein
MLQNPAVNAEPTSFDGHFLPVLFTNFRLDGSARECRSALKLAAALTRTLDRGLVAGVILATGNKVPNVDFAVLTFAVCNTNL